MSSELSVFVGTFLEVPDHKLVKLHKVSRCPVCNVVIKSPYCPKCGTAGNPVIHTKLEPLDVYLFLQEHNIRAHRYFIEEAPNKKTYIIHGRDAHAGIWIDTDGDCIATPIISENQLVPYLEIMQLFDDEKIPCNIVTGAFSHWR